MCLYLDHVDNMTDHRCVFSKVFLRKILYLINEMTIQPKIHIIYTAQNCGKTVY